MGELLRRKMLARGNKDSPLGAIQGLQACARARVSI